MAATHWAYCTPMPWPPAVASLMVDSIKRGGLGLTSPERGEQHGTEGRDPGLGRLGDRLSLGDRSRSVREVAPPGDQNGQRGQVDRQPGERARVAGALQLAGVDRVPALVVPEHVGRHGRQPAPAEVVFRGDLVGGEGASLPAAAWVPLRRVRR